MLHRLVLHTGRKTRLFRFNNNNYSIQIADHVKDAIAQGKPVVALESTIISHGMPYPRNLEVARAVEEVVKSVGAVPATIAIINGVPKIGINSEEMELLGAAPGDKNSPKVWKASRRDLGYVCAMGYHGATTVASTMILAHNAGIRVFATGGCGGVHYGAEDTMDVSADLYELGKTPVAVVCAGIKSILDLPRTMEVLETQGVPVIGYQCTTMPSFFTNNSSISLPMSCSNSEEAARVLSEMWTDRKRCVNDKHNIETGALITVPNPEPIVFNDPKQNIENVIEEALKYAHDNNISGAAITPYLLATIEKITHGSSLNSNIALIKNNARVAAEIAVAYCKRVDMMQSSHCSSSVNENTSATESTTIEEQEVPVERPSFAPVYPDKCDALVIGGAVVDYVAYSNKTANKVIIGSSNPGTMRVSYGGVGRNMAEVVGRMADSNVCLISAVGCDAPGNGLLQHASTCGIHTGMTKTNINNTASYIAVHDGNRGDLVVGIAADMEVFQTELDMGYLSHLYKYLIQNCPPKIVALDGNLSASSFGSIVHLMREQSPDVKLFFDCTSDVKCLLPCESNSLHHLSFIKPNVTELIKMVTFYVQNNQIHSNLSNIERVLLKIRNKIEDEVEISDVKLLGVALFNVMISSGGMKHSDEQSVIVSMGENGILWIGATNILTAEVNNFKHHAVFTEQELRDYQKQLNNKALVVIDDAASVLHLPAMPISNTDIVNTSGAGDTFCGTIVHGLTKQHLSIPLLLRGLIASRECLRNTSAIPTNLTNLFKDYNI